MRWLGLVLAAALVACESVVVTPSPSPSPSLSPTVAPSPTASPAPIAVREEIPRLLLTLPYAPPSIESLGATTARVGVIGPRGPASLAVDANDRIYIWDQARLRVVVYESGKYMRAIALPFVERDATALLVNGDRLYLRAELSSTIEYEIDLTTGALLQAAADRPLYPRSRAGAAHLAARYTFGADAAGLDYAYAAVDYGANIRYERVDPARGVVAYAMEPAFQKSIDAYPRADGALYELAADYGGVGSVYVFALLAPSAAVPPPTTPLGSTAAPVAFGRPVPDRLTATLAGAGSVDLDARSRTAVWWLASLVKERTDLGASPQERSEE